VVSGKVTEVGKNLNAGAFAEFIPVPVRATDCGLPEALSLRMTVA
jgi:hypothetical protein